MSSIQIPDMNSFISQLPTKAEKCQPGFAYMIAQCAGRAIQTDGLALWHSKGSAVFIKRFSDGCYFQISLGEPFEPENVLDVLSAARVIVITTGKAVYVVSTRTFEIFRVGISCSAVCVDDHQLILHHSTSIFYAQTDWKCTSVFNFMLNGDHLEGLIFGHFQSQSFPHPDFPSVAFFQTDLRNGVAVNVPNNGSLFLYDKGSGQPDQSLFFALQHKRTVLFLDNKPVATYMPKAPEDNLLQALYLSSQGKPEMRSNFPLNSPPIAITISNSGAIAVLCKSWWVMIKKPDSHDWEPLFQIGEAAEAAHVIKMSLSPEGDHLALLVDCQTYYYHSGQLMQRPVQDPVGNVHLYTPKGIFITVGPEG